jgi:hypothetical protein
MFRRLTTFAFDERGQDLIEYALLSGLIGMVGLLIYPDIVDKMSAAYADWVADAADVWEPCPPSPASCE